MVPRHEDRYHAKDYQLFEHIVKQAFNQRRKTLRNSLKQEMTDEMWKNISTRSDVRAEDVSIKEFVDLSNTIMDMKKHGDLRDR
jgi:16S rRNA (adenine1518-N6/adenine1519-N6)-dimethyltransferase